mmetsp:Transcript_6954/g.42537  ORF Transcript_6954/g.42537 Transcript_6954/m.42537 type:complete len:87 (+) Transcript_6954:1480-1740(+)
MQSYVHRRFIKQKFGQSNLESIMKPCNTLKQSVARPIFLQTCKVGVVLAGAIHEEEGQQDANHLQFCPLIFSKEAPPGGIIQLVSS